MTAETLWSPFPVLAEVCEAWRQVRYLTESETNWRPCNNLTEDGSRFCRECNRQLITMPDRTSPGPPDEVKQRTASAPIIG